MKAFTDRLRICTSAPIQVVDITASVEELLGRSGVSTGLLTLISNHTTAYVALNESEAGLREDMTDFLARVAPRGAGYAHDVDPVDQRPNAHAHLLGLFMNASQSIPVIDGRPLLGTWQSILFVELDGPREERSLQVQVLGEAPA
jgi:secondary thiamine-phosphate synthase enzyme